MSSTQPASRPGGPVSVLIALTAVLIALVTLFLPTLAGAQAPRADRPTYKVGDRWHIQAVGLGGVLSPAWVRAGGDDQRAPRAQLLWKVESVEDVETPAGTFQAFRITVEGRRGPGVPGSSLLTLWYAPSTERIVKVDSRLEALPFSLAAVTPPALAPAPKTAPPTVAAIVSAEADEYKEALRGFKETVGHRVAAVVDRVQMSLRPLAMEKGLELSATVPDDLPLAVTRSGSSSA